MLDSLIIETALSETEKNVAKIGTTLGSYVVGGFIGDSISKKVIHKTMVPNYRKYMESEEYQSLSQEEKKKKDDSFNRKVVLAQGLSTGAGAVIAGTAVSVINQVIDTSDFDSCFDITFDF